MLFFYFTIQEMVLQLAHHVQNCLHKHNKPQLSFYDKMMANKRQKEERILAAEQQKLQKEIEANKEREEDEVSRRHQDGFSLCIMMIHSACTMKVLSCPV